MIGWTLCSGIGAPEVAAPWVDWRLAAETDAFPRAVLEQRFGYVVPPEQNQGQPLLWGDMTEVTPELALRHGAPLPDLLVAGTPCQAFSIAGLRRGTDDPRGNLTLKFVEICHAIAAAKPDGKLAVLWENVPGVLSDRTNAFGHLLGGLVGALEPLPRPGVKAWPREGMVEGPRARAAWAVLDAQWFGVAQRRRRVFLVVDFGNCVDPAAVLLEPESLRGDTPPRRQTGQAAPTLPSRSTAGGGLGTDFDLDGGLVAHTLKGEGFDASEDGTVRGTPIVPVAYRTAGDGAAYESGEITHPLTTGTDPNAQVVAQPLTVRRLTPTECARLQGFPDDHARIAWRGKPPEDCPDGRQYKAYGNAMAVPVVRYILERMRLSMGFSMLMGADDK